MITHKPGAKRPGRPRIDPDIRDEVALKLGQGWVPARIAVSLQADPRFQQRGTPSERWIQEYARTLKPDLSGEWALLDADPTRARDVLVVLGAVITHSGGRKVSFSKDEARAVVAVRAAAPDLPPYFVYLTAALYLSRQSRDLPTTDLDAFLSLAPWTSPENADAYRWAVQQGFVPEAPVTVLSERLAGSLLRRDPKHPDNENAPREILIGPEDLAALDPDTGATTPHTTTKGLKHGQKAKQR